MADIQVNWGSGGFTVPGRWIPGSAAPTAEQPAGQPAAPQYTEPWVRPGNIVLAVVGLLAKDFRIPLWGAAVADVAGRQMNEQYRYQSYQYFHRFFNF